MSNRNVDIIRQFDGRPIYIYAYVSPDDVVVYVGRTGDPPTRHGAHRKNSYWWTPDLTFAVVDVAIGWYAACNREAKAIRDLWPVANIQLNGRTDDGYPDYPGVEPTVRERKQASLRALRAERGAA